MRIRPFLIILAGLLGVVVLLVVAFQPRKQTRPHEPSPGDGHVSTANAWERAFKWQATNKSLHQLSSDNPEFQAWGRDFMLKAVNDHLAKVPLFGLTNLSLSY